MNETNTLVEYWQTHWATGRRCKCPSVAKSPSANGSLFSKFFTAETREQTRYVGALKEYQRSEFKVTASLNFLNLVQNAITSLGLVIGSLIVAFSVVQGKRSVGEFVMFLTYLTQL